MSDDSVVIVPLPASIELQLELNQAILDYIELDVHTTERHPRRDTTNRSLRKLAKKYAARNPSVFLAPNASCAKFAIRERMTELNDAIREAHFRELQVPKEVGDMLAELDIRLTQ